MWAREHRWRRAAKAHTLDFGICWAKMGKNLSQALIWGVGITLAAVLSIDYRGPRAKQRDQLGGWYNSLVAQPV